MIITNDSTLYVLNLTTGITTQTLSIGNYTVSLSVMPTDNYVMFPGNNEDYYRKFSPSDIGVYVAMTIADGY